MTQARETKRRPFGKGSYLAYKVDDSIPKSSIHYHWTETGYDGKPDSSCPAVPAHWHRQHDEYMEVASGRVSFTIDGKTIELTPSDPMIHIPRLHVHSLQFLRGVPAVLIEKTDPGGDFKEDFFNTVTDTNDGSPNFFSIARGAYDGDTFIALPGGWKWLEVNVMWLLSVAAKWWYPKEPKAKIT